MIKYGIMFFLCLILLYPIQICHADEPEYSQIESVLQELLPTQKKGFQDYIVDLLNGNEIFTLQGLLTQIKDSLFREIQYHGQALTRIFMLCVVCSLFSGFSKSYGTTVSETAFYIIYLLIFTMLTAAYTQLTQIGEQSIHGVLRFMKVLIPTYGISVLFSEGATYSACFCELTLGAVGIIEAVLLYVLLPFCNAYMMLTMANHVAGEDLLSGFTELADKLIRFTCKGMFGIVTGLGALRAMVIPDVSERTLGNLNTVVKAIPGVGDVWSGAAGSLLAAAQLLKGAIGTTACVFLSLICLTPIVKLLVCCLLYRFVAACLQPVADVRIIRCLNGCGRAAELLLMLVFTCFATFFSSVSFAAMR